MLSIGTPWLLGFVQNEHGKQALAVSAKIIKSNILLNDVIFLGMLCACSYTCLVFKGRQFLNLVEKEYSASPRPEHYATLNDTLR